MIVILRRDASEEQVRRIVSAIEEAGFGAHVSRGEQRTIVGAIGTSPEARPILIERFKGLPFVDKVVPVLKPYKLVSMEAKTQREPVRVGDVSVGPDTFTVIAGPCAVESEEQLMAAARAVRDAGARLLRGGAFKPRTSPYDFQGLGEEGLKLLAAARRETGLPVVTEARAAGQVELVARYADVIQVGARNMQNFDLLKEAGRSGMPVVLKRGFASTVEEWLKAAEHVASAGNLNIILCERGIRTYEQAVRFTQDLAIVPVVRELSHLPVIVDPSHASGRRGLVGPVCRAALAIGADGALVEVHPNPDGALCDAAQQLRPKQFEEMMRRLRRLAAALDREM
ncbi:MAG: 3-deoxy-7-phosphoheptulonate synthase [Planctomycetes bacterium]|nr:3-deoxy-7-phosphoheptulonate synthase [Planctomycetota bacterium]